MKSSLLSNILTLFCSLCAVLLLAAPAMGQHAIGEITAPQDGAEIVISEILAHTDAPYDDAVELYNTSTVAVDLSGWLFTDDNDVADHPLSDWVHIPDGVIIEPNSYYVIKDAKPTEWAFGLSEAGESIFIFRPNPQGGAPIQVEKAEFGTAPSNVSFIRYVDSTGQAHFAIQEGEPTLGFANRGPRVNPMVIEEIMYNPPPGGSEHVVIMNASSTPRQLFDPNSPANTWKLIGNDNEVLVFPQSVTIAAYERIILSEVDPAQFRQDHNIPGNIRIFGPFASKLSNDSEYVALAAPLQPETDGTVNYVFVDQVEYSSEAPWPAVSNNGQALVRRNTTRYANDVSNWFAWPPLWTVNPPPLTDFAYLPIVSGTGR